jgi:hypothetical protein
MQDFRFRFPGAEFGRALGRRFDPAEFSPARGTA